MAGRRLSMIIDTTKNSVTRRLSMLVTKVDRDKLLSESVVVDNKVFGVELKTAVMRSNRLHYMLPDVVYKCLVYLDKKGVEEGIFRMSGSATDILKFKEQFNQGGDVDISTYGNPHTIAGLLKLFLRELPQPLMSSDIDPADELSVITSVKSMLDACPQENQCLLGCLFMLLNKISEEEEITKMSIKNLVIVFSAALCCSGTVVTTMIKNVHEFFPENWLYKTESVKSEVVGNNSNGNSNSNSNSNSSDNDSDSVDVITLQGEVVKKEREYKKDDKKDLVMKRDDNDNNNKNKADNNTNNSNNNNNSNSNSNNTNNSTANKNNETVKKGGKWEGVDYLIAKKGKSDEDDVLSHRRTNSMGSNSTSNNNSKSGGSKSNTPIIGRWRKKTIFEDEEDVNDELPKNRANGDIFFN